MAKSLWFTHFEPKSGDLPPSNLAYFSDIAERARSILSFKSENDIDKAAHRISLEIKGYLSDHKDMVVNDLLAKFHDDPETYKDFFVLRQDASFTENWIYNDEMDEDLGIITELNVNDVEVLKAIIENRDCRIFYPEDAVMLEIEHWHEGETHELFAVLALMRLDASARYSNIGLKNTYNTLLAAECVMEALDAICFAEQTRNLAWQEVYLKNQFAKVSANHEVEVKSSVKMAREAVILEQIAKENKKKTSHAGKMNKARHQPTIKIKNLVCEKWIKSKSDFVSAERAGIFYAEWLETESLGYMNKGAQQYFQARTVTSWIRVHAKENGIKFR